jgi:hypothetical protein
MIYKTYDTWLAALETQLRQRGIKSIDRIGIDLWEYFERKSPPDVAADSIIQRGRKEQIFFRADMSVCLKQLEALFKAMPDGKMQALIEACILHGISLYCQWAKWMEITQIGHEGKIPKMAKGESFGLFELFDLALAGANIPYKAIPSGEVMSLDLGNLLLIEQGQNLFGVCPQELLMALNSLQKRGCLFTSDSLPTIRPLQVNAALADCEFRFMVPSSDPLHLWENHVNGQLHQVGKLYWHRNAWIVDARGFQDTYRRSFANTQAPYFTHPDTFREKLDMASLSNLLPVESRPVTR